MSDVIRRFFKAKEVGIVLDMQESTVRNWAARKKAGTLYAQCRRGRWHLAQVRLIEAVEAGAITTEEAEYRWQRFKHDILVEMEKEKKKKS